MQVKSTFAVSIKLELSLRMTSSSRESLELELVIRLINYKILNKSEDLIEIQL